MQQDLIRQFFNDTLEDTLKQDICSYNKSCEACPQRANCIFKQQLLSLSIYKYCYKNGQQSSCDKKEVI